ncbi:unnamed protein product, partial [marine sediment metagenome]
QSGHDYEPAMEFGELIYLSEGYWSRYDVNKMYREFTYRLEGSQRDDFILLTGLPVMQCLAVSIFAMKHGRINILQFRQKDKRKFYLEHNIVFPKAAPGFMYPFIPEGMDMDWEQLKKYLDKSGALIPIKKKG